ncbi:hypothetical protein [Desulfotomaculum sp. 1211_IL3151]|uniref:hypothetical protein n=1 Tax=Desulfotomaculum sp. 1211_IL3151 TaxID=3084055 RepID=UPI002FDB55D4
MDKELLVKDIVFMSTHWGSEKEKDRERVENTIMHLLETFPVCQHCNESSDNKFWIIEEIRRGFLLKKYESNVFSVCSLKCLFDWGLNKDAYYSIVVRLASNNVLSTGFAGLNAMALNEFATEINRAR